MKKRKDNPKYNTNHNSDNHHISTYHFVFMINTFFVARMKNSFQLNSRFWLLLLIF